jgi:hypothetical protein
MNKATTLRLAFLLISILLVAGLARAADTETNLLTNGSFEFWSHVSMETLPSLLKDGVVYDGKDPLIPTRWTWRLANGASLTRSGDAHGGKYSLAIKGDGGSLGLGSLEVVPDATYSFGVWAKGSGRVVVRLTGQAPEGGQNLGEVVGQATGQWQLIGQKVKIPGHIRVVDLAIEVGRGEGNKPADLVLDDAHISAPLDFAYDADDVLSKKLTADADTILLADFEKDDPAIKLGNKCVYVKEGRFGRALRVEKPEAAMIPLKLDKMPPEGTIEFWLSPDQVEQLDWQTRGTQGPPQYHFLAICDSGGNLGQFQADTSCTLRWAWDTDPRVFYSGPKRGNSVAGPSELSLQRMRKGQWTHVAVTWDASAVRMYVDGVMYGRTTQGPLAWRAGAITNLSVSNGMYGHLCWNGMIDEIRVSKVKRFGPFLPKGAVAKPLPPAKDLEEDAPVAALKPALTAEQLLAERAKLVAQIAPTATGAFEEKANAAGDYVYEAPAAKPLVIGGKFELETDYQKVKGLTTAVVGETFGRLIGDAVNAGAYWKLGPVAPGKYWVGLLYESQRDTQGGAESPQGSRPLEIFLNGRIIQQGSTANPVQIAPKIWFTELRSLDAEALKPGDEIEAVVNGGGTARIVRLLLHAKPPVIGAGRAGLHFGENWWTNVDTSLRVNPVVMFVDKKGNPISSRDPWWGMEQVADSAADFLTGAGGKPVAYCLLSNPLPVPVTVDFDCMIKGYWGQVAGDDAQKITLQPHERLVRKIPFTLTDDDPAYSIKATVKGCDAGILPARAEGVPPASSPSPVVSSSGKEQQKQQKQDAGKMPATHEGETPSSHADKMSATRALGWPEFDSISFFPGYRQMVPWHDPTVSSQAKRVFFKQPLNTERRTLSINGMWQRAFFYELVPAAVPPADAKWEDAFIPVQISQELLQVPRRQFGAYYRRTFDLADDGTARTYRLVISDAYAEATAYVNGTRVGQVRGTSTPMVADISTALKPGKNEILVVVRDILAVMDPDYVNTKNPVPSVLYLDAPSSWEAVNRIYMGDVSIEASPAVAADGLLITTSVRKKTIAANFAVVNHTAAPVKVTVKATALDAREKVVDLGAKELTLEVNKPVPLSFTQPWENAKTWSPADPHLYVLAVEITDSATGKRLDLCRQRFGFRETWIENASIMFNGIPIKPKGVTTPAPYGMDLDYTMSRGAGIPDYMDENGFLASDNLAGVANSGSKHNVDRDAFWDSARANVLAGAKRMQNHPCVIAWDLSNEWYGFLSYSGADPLLGAKRLRSLTEVLEVQDPTRWTFYNGDEDLSRLHYAFSGHYINHNGDVYDGYMMDGHSAYLPDGWFFRRLDEQFKVGQEVLVNPWRRTTVPWGKELLMNTENLWKTGGMMPPGPTRFEGEEDVLSPAVDHTSGAAAWMYKQNLDGHRDLEAPICAFYGGVCPSRRGWMLQQFIMPDTAHHAYSGATVTRDYSLHSDLYVPAKVKFVWQLLGPDGKPVAGIGGEDAADMTSGGVKRGTVKFDAPKVDKRATFTLDMRMFSDGKFAYGEQRDLEVLPKPTAEKSAMVARKVGLYDPSGKTAHALDELTDYVGVDYTELKDLSDVKADIRTVIIGEDALTEASAAETGKLEKFVSDGGRVFIFAQKVTPGGLPVTTSLEPKMWASQTFIQAPDHPVVQGVSPWDLQFWAPDRVVARGAYTKPDGGPCTVILDSGGATGMEWVQMMMCYRGKGSYLLCQLPLISKFDQDPMAREILAGIILNCAGDGGWPATTPDKTLKALAAPGSLVQKRLEEVGVKTQTVLDAAPLAAGDVGLIDATHKDAAATAGKWKDSLAKGATVVVTGATPADAAWLSDLAGKSVRLTVQPYHMWEGRGYRNGNSPLTAGLTQLDLYWKTYDGSEGAGSQAENPQYAIESLNDYSVAVDGGRESVFPGAMVELTVGIGRLVIDQRRWMTPNEQLKKLACRNVSALALGLGVAIAPVVPVRELPQAVTYKPIDLSIWANRSMTDKTPDDGKDGWPDQGARCDAHGFPTGSQNFQGVPFEIGKPANNSSEKMAGRGAKSVVVLRNVGRPGAADFPTEVTIPIGSKAEGFYFLHSSAFTAQNSIVGIYQIQYADGSTLDVPLASGINIHDWSGECPGFAREKTTRSNIAWTGSNEIFPIISVFRMLWVNPQPQAPVKAVRFVSNGNATLVLAGLTAVLAQGQQDVTPAQIAKARASLAEAAKAVDAGKLDEAEKLLLSAVKDDPALTAARQALADLYERKGDEAAAFKTYQDWVAAGAATPLPYNRIGEILEKRKDFKGALDAYTKSLAVEWNQPPIIDAKSRLQKMKP